VSFAVKIWGITREFSANIETQRPDDRIKWKVSQGMTHTGVVSFRELAPNLTRVELGFDVDPGGLFEKFARGARHVKRASRGDFHRFKGFIEMAEQETGAWRGVIEDGELVEEHDPSYDEQRQYSDIEELTDQESEGGEEEEEESSREKRSQKRQPSGRGNRQKQNGSREQSKGRGQSRSQASSRRQQSRASSQSRGRSGSSRRGSGGSGGGSSSRGRTSQSSSSGRSASKGRTRSQSGKR
jgi:uncharacterized membrane protein YgcG